jgi:hypothetical protein
MTDTPEEWGPWIEHDGKCCPVKDGDYVEVTKHVGRWGNIETEEGVIRSDTPRGSWLQVHLTYGPCIQRYRIRKPRGLTILEGLLEDLPEREREDA